MSKFLAPIHFWLFNKVEIHEDLETDLEEIFKAKYGDEVTSIVNANIEKYGERVSDKKLDDIIDQGNIHGWLQNTITVAETRQAAILADLIEKYGDEAIDLATSVHKDHAAKNAVIAKATRTVDTPEEIYKTIGDYILDGMPCDSAGNVTKSEADVLEAQSNGCLHINYWNTAGLDADTMYKLRGEWTKAFVNELNPNFIYNVDINKSDNGSRSFVYTIKRK